MVQLHDTGYKYIFSHADPEHDLLEISAPPAVADLPDFATLRGDRQFHHLGGGWHAFCVVEYKR